MLTLVLFLVPVVTMTVLLSRMVISVPSGEVGVLWRYQDGTVLDTGKLKDSGVHIILPWDKLFIYNLRVQSFAEGINAVSSDNVNMNVIVNSRFRLQRDAIPVLHEVFGVDYVKLLGQEIASEARAVLAQYTADQIVSTARQDIEEKTLLRARDKLPTVSWAERRSNNTPYVELYGIDIESSPRTRP
jgi:prohibitin 2